MKAAQWRMVESLIIFGRSTAFSCLAKMLVAVIRTPTISAGALWVGVLLIETDAEEDAVLLVGCFHCHEVTR